MITSGQCIKKKRIKLKMTQMQLANAIGYNINQFICLMENGHSPIPTSKLKEIIKALKFTKEERMEFQNALVCEYINKLDEAVS